MIYYDFDSMLTFITSAEYYVNPFLRKKIDMVVGYKKKKRRIKYRSFRTFPG